MGSFVLQSEVIDIKNHDKYYNWTNYCEVGKCSLPDDRYSSLRIPEMLNLCYICKEEEMTPPPQMRKKLTAVFLIVIIAFYQSPGKLLGNYSFRGVISVTISDCSEYFS